MREIKFRGKRIDNSEWVYGYYVYCRHHAYILPIYNEDDPDPCFDERWIQEGADDEGWIEVIPETVGQFAGLKDKNGKEIYEGDVLRQEDDRFLSGHKDRLVEWGVGCYMLRDTHIPQSIQLSGGGHPWEVIGNIHENPELIEKND